MQSGIGLQFWGLDFQDPPPCLKPLFHANCGCVPAGRCGFVPPGPGLCHHLVASEDSREAGKGLRGAFLTEIVPFHKNEAAKTVCSWQGSGVWSDRLCVPLWLCTDPCTVIFSQCRFLFMLQFNLPVTKCLLLMQWWIRHVMGYISVKWPEVLMAGLHSLWSDWVYSAVHYAKSNSINLVWNLLQLLSVCMVVRPFFVPVWLDIDWPVHVFIIICCFKKQLCCRCSVYSTKVYDVTIEAQYCINWSAPNVIDTYAIPWFSKNSFVQVFFWGGILLKILNSHKTSIRNSPFNRIEKLKFSRKMNVNNKTSRAVSFFLAWVAISSS